MEMTALSGAASASTTRERVASVDDRAFAAAMQAVDVARALSFASMPDMAPVPSPPAGARSSREVLARQLDELGRHRVEAQALSEDLAGAWASGLDSPTLAVSMHRHARAMASYNLGVMWGAKLIGVTASAIRQLVAAT